MSPSPGNVGGFFSLDVGDGRCYCSESITVLESFTHSIIYHHDYPSSIPETQRERDLYRGTSLFPWRTSLRDARRIVGRQHCKTVITDSTVGLVQVGRATAIANQCATPTSASRPRVSEFAIMLFAASGQECTGTDKVMRL